VKLSVVATLYQSASYIHEFHRRASDAASKLVGDSYEIVLVNDGSPDNSLELATQLTETDAHVVVVDLSRNFGHHKAMMTGLSYSKGEQVFLIDIDLEEEPEILLSFAKELEAESCDVVFGVQQQRKGKGFERVSGQWFWRVFNLLTGLKLPENVATARLMSRRYVDALLTHKEREVFMAGLWHITGFKQVPQPILKHSTSVTTYTLRRKVSLLVNSITSFSNAPLVSIFYFGLMISIAASGYIVFLLINWGLGSKPLSGWTSVMASIWLLGGLIMSSIGVVGIYMSKIFSEIKQRPYTIVRQVYGRRQ
jgi:putative glycosyltransferase